MGLLLCNFALVVAVAVGVVVGGVVVVVVVAGGGGGVGAISSS